MLDNIPVDCEFPQLREIGDARKLAHTLQRHLELSTLEREMYIENCKIDQLHYKRGHNCRMVFTVKLRHPDGLAGNGGSKQIYFGKLFHSPKDEEAFESIDRQKLAQPHFGPAVMHIPEWAIVLWAYPNDPNLPGLPFMLDTDKVLAMIKAAPEKFGLKRAPEALSARMTKYVPGKRCGFIYRPPEGTNSSWALYGKAYGDHKGENAYMIKKQIWESAARQRGEFLLAQPYHYDPETQILWREALRGQPVAEVAENLPHLPEMVREIGQRLAVFHGTPLQLPKEMTFDFQVEKVREAVTAITETFPDYARACSAVGQKILDAAARLGPGPLTPLHGSFKFSHIFATKKGIAFIDFDGVNLGDPGYDLGRFIAFVYRMSARKEITVEMARQTVMNFCAGYNGAAASPVPQERIDWFAASHLLISEVCKSVKRMKTGLVNRLLEIADPLCPT